MADSELAFYTTEELITELLSRSTFLGVIVHAPNDLKREWEAEQVFKVRFNGNLDTPQVGRLLDVVARRLDEQCC